MELSTGNCDALSCIPCQDACRHCHKHQDFQDDRARYVRAASVMPFGQSCSLPTQDVSRRKKYGITQRIRSRTTVTCKRFDGGPPANCAMKGGHHQSPTNHSQHCAFMADKTFLAEVANQPPDMKYWWWTHLLMVDTWKTLQASVLSEHHQLTQSGHFGVSRTYNRLRASPYF